MGRGAELLAQVSFDIGGAMVSLFEGHISGETEVHFDGYGVADAASVKSVDIGNVGGLVDDFFDTIFGVDREALFEEFTGRFLYQHEGSLDDEEADD